MRIPTPTPVARYICPNGPRGECVLSTLVIVVSPMKRSNPPCPPCTSNARTPGGSPTVDTAIRQSQHDGLHAVHEPSRSMPRQRSAPTDVEPTAHLECAAA